METPAVLAVLPVIREMIGLELALAALYRTCGERFPEDREFWWSVQHQEEGHARILEGLSALIAAHPERFQAGRTFRAAAIGTFVSQVARAAQQVRGGKLARRRALVIARDFESSVLEARYGDIVTTDDPEYRSAVERIGAETQRHRSRFQERLDGVL